MNHYCTINTYLNFFPDLGEIIEAFSRKMQELAPLLLCGIGLSFNLQQLQNQRPSGANIFSPRQEIPPDKSFQHAGFPTALASNDRHLRQLDRRLAPELREYVLQLIHHRYD